MKVELVARREDLNALCPRWDELALEDPRDGFFRTSGWYRAWMEHIRPDAEPFVVVVRNADGVIVGLAPLCRMTYRDLGFRFEAVAWAGRETVSGDFLDFVTAAGCRAEAVAAILDFLWEAHSRWGLLMFGELMDGGDSYNAVEGLAKRRNIPFRVQEERICPYIALPGSFDEYLNSLSSSTRYHIRRRMRDLEKAGARVDIYPEGPALAERLDTLARLHIARWSKDHLPGTLGRPGFAAFLRQICTTAPTGARCRLYEISHEGTPVASLLSFYYGHSALYYQAGWDPDSPLTACSPGVVAMAYSIRDAIANGMRYYEFLRGDEAYKSRWTKTFRKTVTALMGGGLMARGYLETAHLKDLVKQRLGIGRPGNPPSASQPADSMESAAAK